MESNAKVILALQIVSTENHNRSCCVAGCCQATRKWMTKGGLTKVTFHSIRRPKENRKKWIEALQRHNGADWAPKRDSRVCSVNFAY